MMTNAKRRSARSKAKKPAVAFLLETTARRNLELKVEALKSMLDLGAKPPEVPTSVRRFNSWCGPVTDGVDILAKNANETLVKYPDILESVRSLVQAAKIAGKPQKETRELRLTRARNKAQLHLTIRQIAEAELLRTRHENTRLRGEVEALKGQVDSIGEESRRLRVEFEEALAKLREQHAAVLRSRPVNVRPIRGDD